MRPDGVVLEAPTSSVFWVAADGTLRTPALSAGILDSITRDVLIGGLEVEEGEFGRDDLLGATEAFLASTNREVQAISHVDGTPLNTVSGPVAQAAKSCLDDAVAAELAAARS